jgi:hypothetical protein
MRQRVVQLLVAVVVVATGVVAAETAAGAIGEQDLVQLDVTVVDDGTLVDSPDLTPADDAPLVVSPDSTSWD